MAQGRCATRAPGRQSPHSHGTEDGLSRKGLQGQTSHNNRLCLAKRWQRRTLATTVQVMLRYAGTLKVGKYKQKETEKTLASQRTRKWQLGQTSPGRLAKCTSALLGQASHRAHLPEPQEPSPGGRGLRLKDSGGAQGLCLPVQPWTP